MEDSASAVHSHVSIDADAGKGRTVCILIERSSRAGHHHEQSAKLHQGMSEKARSLVISFPEINDGNWQVLTEEFLGLIEQRAIKQASVVAIGPTATLLLYSYLRAPRFVRTAVFIDATSRPHPSVMSRIVDWLESHLPLGLPLRLRSAGFDAKSFLHRIRCPSLVVTTPHASAYQASQAIEMSARMPTAWRLSSAQTASSTPEREDEALINAILDFYDVPARCPQKNLVTEPQNARAG